MKNFIPLQLKVGNEKFHSFTIRIKIFIENYFQLKVCLKKFHKFFERREPN
jgi:hypothetical protein